MGGRHWHGGFKAKGKILLGGSELGSLREDEFMGQGLGHGEN